MFFESLLVKRKQPLSYVKQTFLHYLRQVQAIVLRRNRYLSYFLLCVYCCHILFCTAGAGIMEADDRQMSTVFTVQPSFHHWHSTNRVS